MDRIVGGVNQIVICHFIELLGLCIRGCALDERGEYREEPMTAMRRIRLSIPSRPGRCFADRLSVVDLVPPGRSFVHTFPPHSATVGETPTAGQGGRAP